MERDITSDTLPDIKQKVQDKSRSVGIAAAALCSTLESCQNILVDLFLVEFVEYSVSAVVIVLMQ